MSKAHTYVMSIAGLDPSGGAGLLADIKTFEQLGVYGLAVNTANTIQTESHFHSVSWTPLQEVLACIDALVDEYPIQYVKTGIMPSFGFLLSVMTHLKKKQPDIRFIVDPVIRSSTAFEFHSTEGDAALARLETLKHTYLLTPNIMEACELTGQTDARQAATQLSEHCHVLLKGGHNAQTPGVDYLYTGNKLVILQSEQPCLSPKHGSGCVLSSAIAAHLALGYELEMACRHAKHYTEQFLNSHTSLLGTHA